MKKYLLAVLAFAGCLGILSGCGKQEESVPTAEENVPVVSSETETAKISSKAETSAKSKKEASTEANTAETESSAEETSDTVSESETNQNASETAVSTAVTSSGNASVTTTVAVSAETQVQQAETQADVQIDDNPPDVPAEVNLVTEAEVQIDAPDPDAGITATEAEVQTSELSMTISYQGNSLTVGESAKSFVDAVKPGMIDGPAPSCYGDGENINYIYDDMTVYVWNQNENYQVYSVDINAPGIVSVSGMDIGSAVTFDGEKRFDLGDGYSITVSAVGGTVSLISYNMDL